VGFYICSAELDGAYGVDWRCLETLVCVRIRKMGLPGPTEPSASDVAHTRVARETVAALNI
jgi:hypothetical protein